MEILPRRGMKREDGNEHGNKITVHQQDQNKSNESAGALSAMRGSNIGVLCKTDAEPVAILREDAASAFVLVGDHAGRAIPASLGDLGLSEADRARHIAWDIGVAGVGTAMSEALRAPLVAQVYSRLVIDCNRTPGHLTSIAPSSDGTLVPANQDLGEVARDDRVREIFQPYHAAISGLLDRRAARGVPSVLVALHSFTPMLRRPSRPSGADARGARPWHVGVLFNHDPRFAMMLGDLLRHEGDLVVGDNEPYALSDEDDYTVPVHGERRGLPHVEIEIRQDLIGDAQGQAAWAERLSRLLPEAWLRYRDRWSC